MGFRCLAVLLLSVAPLAVAAQEKFPTRPVQMIMPTPPGGGTDILGRKLAEAVEPFLKQKVVIENKPGGGGSIGIAQAAQARPDGYTIAGVFNGALTTLPHTMNLPYSLDQLTPMLQIGSGSYVVCAREDFPASTAEELIQTLKAAPNKYTLGNDGVGNTMQLAAERILGHFGAKTRPVPFGGAGETARNFLGGHVDLYGGSILAILPHVKAGKAKCPLLTSAEDNPALPGASGLKRLGVPELETVLWWGILTPKGVPAERFNILRDAFKQAMETPAYRETLERLGATPTFREGEALAKYIKSEHDALGEVAKTLGLEKK
jgi:tripartite-type tricarboxylate transporter receptor subunit TctC